ncbi:cyclic nucleotide-binding domain-containing protein [Paraburkholderia sp. CNPSo 3157]|uniref:Cyclic nucleotide-binding domain-containing protein n=1 Tax=Paraburkholderia franconis TaxID=2654983 RepID=A0A7X1TFY2_9BURK|nr:Crp/Fnr family transcriptional regulator [Paraburkholderia franconis]MPW17639.1 cyclic nucleotide-binding domain-containing protein [Paraburkholderia franconis]
MKNETPSHDLRNLALFSSATNEEIELATGLARVNHFTPGEYVAFSGDASSPLFMLLEGELRSFVSSEDGHEIPMRTYSAGQTFGAATIIQRAVLPWNIAAITHATVAILNRAQAMSLMRSPRIAPAVNEMMSADLLQMVQRYSVTGLSRASARVSALIATSIGDKKVDEWPAVEIPDQATVAALAKVSRETVSRVLKSLESRGVIVRIGRRLRIRDITMLRRIASGVELA